MFVMFIALLNFRLKKLLNIDENGFLGYDQIPIDIGLEIGSHGGGNGSAYSPIEAMDVAIPNTDPDLSFDPIDQLPTPPQDNNQVAAWYDTDL